jgi:hypothetical protein
MVNKIVEIVILISMVLTLILIAAGGFTGEAVYQIIGMAMMIAIGLMSLFGPSSSESRQLKQYFYGEPKY